MGESERSRSCGGSVVYPPYPPPCLHRSIHPSVNNNDEDDNDVPRRLPKNPAHFFVLLPLAYAGTTRKELTKQGTAAAAMAHRSVRSALPFRSHHIILRPIALGRKRRRSGSALSSLLPYPVCFGYRCLIESHRIVSYRKKADCQK